MKNKFWGVDEQDELVDQQVLAENTKAFFNVDQGAGTGANRGAAQSKEDAMDVFFGMDDKPIQGGKLRVRAHAR